MKKTDLSYLMNLDGGDSPAGKNKKQRQLVSIVERLVDNQLELMRQIRDRCDPNGETKKYWDERISALEESIMLEEELRNPDA